MNETQAPVKFLFWMLAVGIAFGLIGSLKIITYKMAKLAIEAHQKDQMSYGKFSRQLWTAKKEIKYKYKMGIESLAITANVT